MTPVRSLALATLVAGVVLVTGCSRQVATAPVTAPPRTATTATPAEPTTTVPTTVTASTTTSVETTTTATQTPGIEPAEGVDVSSPSERTLEEWLEIVAAIGPVTVPSDCDLGLDEPASLPNASRDYRAGVHEGVDMICGEYGHDAVAALPGRVVVANASFVDPEPDERTALLEEARELGHTPRWILEMLYGRFVVLDHGLIPGAGHVTTVYAHFEQVDPALRPGLYVDAGTRLGEIGNRGTATASSGGTRSRSIHLHWEIWVGEDFLGQGLDSAQTKQLYEALLLSRAEGS